MRIEGKDYKTIWFEDNCVKIIDQTKLPHKFIIKDLKTVQDTINSIKNLHGDLFRPFLLTESKCTRSNGHASRHARQYGRVSGA